MAFLVTKFTLTSKKSYQRSHKTPLQSWSKHNEATVHKTFAQYLIQYLHNICKILVQYLYNICTTFKLYLNNIMVLLLIYFDNNWKIFSQYLCNIHTIVLQYLSKMFSFANFCTNLRLLMHALRSLCISAGVPGGQKYLLFMVP